MGLHASTAVRAGTGCTSGGRLDDEAAGSATRRAFTCDATVLGRPVRVVFGAGTLAQVAPEARALGSRVLLVAGRHEDDAADRVSAEPRRRPGRAGCGT